MGRVLSNKALEELLKLNRNEKGPGVIIQALNSKLTLKRNVPFLLRPRECLEAALTPYHRPSQPCHITKKRKKRKEPLNKNKNVSINLSQAFAMNWGLKC